MRRSSSKSHPMIDDGCLSFRSAPDWEPSPIPRLIAPEPVRSVLLITLPEAFCDRLNHHGR